MDYIIIELSWYLNFDCYRTIKLVLKKRRKLQKYTEGKRLIYGFYLVISLEDGFYAKIVETMGILAVGFRP